jgi:peptide/nickel transport system permease protein
MIASLLVVGVIRLLPGDIISTMQAGGRGGRSGGTEEAEEYTRSRLGLDAPFHKQYVRWMFGWPKTQGFVYRTSDAGETWNQMAVGVIKPFDQLTFLTPVLGWGLAENMIFNTDDGGRLWSRQYNGDENFHSMFILDEDRGWAVGDNGTILHTSEGGKRSSAPGAPFTWVAQNSNTDQRLTDVVFLESETALTGWAVGDNGVVIRSDDGGASWQTQSTPIDTGLSSVGFADERTGWAVGEAGTILATNDGGNSWVVRNSGTEEDLNAVAFADSLNVWAVGKSGSVLRSSNGGAAWAPLNVSAAEGIDLNDLVFGSADAGMIVGSGGTILSTADGGASWTVREIALTARENGEIVDKGTVGDPVVDVNLTVSSSGTVRAWITTKETSWRWGVIGGNLGERFLFFGESVRAELGRKLGPSVQLMIMSIAMALVVSIPIGIYSAIRQDTVGDYVGRTFAIGGLAVPSFWFGSMAILVPSYYLGFWQPRLIYVSFFDNPAQNLYFYLLPAIVAALPAMAETMRMTRSMMLEVLRQDYVRTAWSKGLRERAVIVKHALKNAMIPVITLIGLLIPFQLGELVIIERIFNIPGVGGLMLTAIEDRDYPLIQGVAMFMGVVVVGLNLAVDLIYSWLDPRIRYN